MTNPVYGSDAFIDESDAADGWDRVGPDDSDDDE